MTPAQKLSDVFDALQNLEIKPTPNNTEILHGIYSVLREVYSELEGGETDGRNETDHAGRDDD